MAIILHLFTEHVHEAHIPRDDQYERPWWAEPPIWQVRAYATTVSRPCEDSVFKRLEDEARALKHQWRYVNWLKPDEQRLLHLERECLRRNVAMTTQADRASWIAAQMGGEWTARGVRLALEDVTDMLIHAANEHVTEVLVKWGRRKLERGEKAQVLEELLRAA